MRHKIGVLTFHRCVNYGSYWQARCLLEWLERRGHSAVLLDHMSDAVRRAELRCALSPTLPTATRSEDISRYVRKIRAFRRAVQRLPRTAPFPLDQPHNSEPCDLVIVGSDEVFNLDHPWYGGWPLFFGEGVPRQRLAAYAASFGNYQRDCIGAPWRNWISNFDAISVREQTAIGILDEVGLSASELALDPCLLYPPDQRDADPDGADARYLAVYGHSFPDWFTRRMLRWARARSLRLVSIGYRNDWADDQRIDAGPEAFRMLMSNAAAVATNFFHGCVFALLNRKPFACAASAYRSNKVLDLAALLGAGRHLVSESAPHAIDAALEASPEPAVYKRIAAMRERSEAFLDRVLA
jgi:hypothetical protein